MSLDTDLYMPTTRRLTMGQAIVEFLTCQYTSLDGVEQPFFGGVFSIFGHGNVAGIGQALLRPRLGRVRPAALGVPSERP